MKLYKQVTGAEGGTQAHSPDPTADGNQGGGDAWSKGWGKPQPLPTQSLFYPTQGNSSLVISSEVHYLKKKKDFEILFLPAALFFFFQRNKRITTHTLLKLAALSKGGAGVCMGEGAPASFPPLLIPTEGKPKGAPWACC